MRNALANQNTARARESSNQKAAQQKKSKKEIVEMENQLEFLQNKLAMMEKANMEKKIEEAMPPLITGRPSPAAGSYYLNVSLILNGYMTKNF